MLTKSIPYLTKGCYMQDSKPYTMPVFRIPETLCYPTPYQLSIPSLPQYLRYAPKLRETL